MNIYLYEIKALRKSTITWTIVLVALAALFLSVYPGAAKDAQGFKDLLGNYPPTVRAMLGINLDTIVSILGFYSMIFSFIVLCGGVQATNLGLSILSKESRERTADFLLVKPVSRTEVVTAKLLAAFTSLLITDFLFCSLSALIANLVKTADFSVKIFVMINLTLFFIQLILMALGVVISVFFNKLRTVLPISLGLVFGLYMIGALFASGKDEEAVRFLSPFKYFSLPYIIQNAGYEAPYLIAGAVIVALSVTASYFIYNRKDIHSVS